MSEREETAEIPAAEIGQGLSGLRTIPEKSVETMSWSLKRHGQLTPVVLARMVGSLEMVDGFKRLRATLRALDGRPLRCRVITMSRQAAKIAMYCLNHGSAGLNELEEALLVRSLHREEGMNQVQIGSALGRHKTWVCRRLQLIERLTEQAQEALQLGVLRVTAARLLAKLPRCNQLQLLDSAARQDLSTRQLAQVVELFEKAVSSAERQAIMGNPEGALRARKRPETTLDERLSPSARKAIEQISLMGRIGGSLADYLTRSYPTATSDHSLMAPWLLRLKNTMNLLDTSLNSLCRSS